MSCSSNLPIIRVSGVKRRRDIKPSEINDLSVNTIEQTCYLMLVVVAALPINAHRELQSVELHAV